jgi:hypothetical protein
MHQNNPAFLGAKQKRGAIKNREARPSPGTQLPFAVAAHEAPVGDWGLALQAATGWPAKSVLQTPLHTPPAGVLAQLAGKLPLARGVLGAEVQAAQHGQDGVGWSVFVQAAQRGQIKSQPAVFFCGKGVFLHLLVCPVLPHDQKHLQQYFCMLLCSIR